MEPTKISPHKDDPPDLRTNPFQEGGDDTRGPSPPNKEQHKIKEKGNRVIPIKGGGELSDEGSLHKCRHMYHVPLSIDFIFHMLE